MAAKENAKLFKFIAKIAIKGDFDALDGLGEAQQEIAAGVKAGTTDEKLYDSLIANGYAKKATKSDDDDAEVAQSSTTTTAVKSTDKK